MKKTLIALAVLATSGAAMAQSTFTLYGIADASLERIKGDGSVNRLTSGGLQGSRFGLKGSEDLGGGLKGVFQIESGFSLDDGTGQQARSTTTALKDGIVKEDGVTIPDVAVTGTTAGSTARLFGRQAYVGLEGSFGAVRLGRQYTPIGNVADMVGTKGYDVLSLTKTYGADGAYRADNAITYRSPSISGFTAEAQYSLNINGSETNSGDSPKQGRAFSFNGVYANGPIRAALGYIALDDVNSTTVGNQKRNELLVVAGYDLGVANLTGYMSQTEVGIAATKADRKMKVYGLSAAFPLGAITLTPGIAMAKDVNGSSDAATDDDATFLTLQAKYDLSKRTALYSNITNVSNKSNSALGFNSVKNDISSYGVQVGVRHSF